MAAAPSPPFCTRPSRGTDGFVLPRPSPLSRSSQSFPASPSPLPPCHRPCAPVEPAADTLFYSHGVVGLSRADVPPLHRTRRFTSCFAASHLSFLSVFLISLSTLCLSLYQGAKASPWMPHAVATENRSAPCRTLLAGVPSSPLLRTHTRAKSLRCSIAVAKPLPCLSFFRTREEDERPCVDFSS